MSVDAKLLVFIGIVSIVLLVPSVSYGTWREQPLEELWEQSQTIFVGTVTSVDTVQVEKTLHMSVEENGIEKHVVENYIMDLDEYDVEIELFFKNPQNFDTITVREPTVSAGVYQSTIAGYETGDRVLFYLKNIDGTNIYSPESKKIEVDNQLYYFQDELKKISDEKSSNYTVGTIQWLEAIYPPTGTAVIRVVDPDMNLNPEWIDNFDIFVWSDSNKKGYAPTATETGVSTGIFESTLFFSLNYESSGPRLKVEEGDTVTAEYEDNTLPASYAEDVLSVIAKSEIHTPLESPLKQFKSGIEFNEIHCRDNLVLIQKYDNFPACVKSKSVPKLIERGWMTIENISSESSRLCNEIPDVGMCKAAIEKYYFDFESDSCKSFTWGGCVGNVPFDTMELCQGLCGVKNEN